MVRASVRDAAPRRTTAAQARRQAAAAHAQPWTVVLADRHQMVRAAVKALLSGISGFEVIGEARTGAELVSLVERARPDLVLTEVSMPDMDAFIAIARIHQRHPGVRLLALSEDESVDAVQRAIASGACGYLLKRAPVRELEQAVRSAMMHGVYCSQWAAQGLLAPAAHSPGPRLTPRQTQILTLIAQGHSSRQIAGRLGLSSKTIDVHRGRIMARLDLNDVPSLTRYALRAGLLADAVAGGK